MKQKSLATFIPNQVRPRLQSDRVTLDLNPDRGSDKENSFKR